MELEKQAWLTEKGWESKKLVSLTKDELKRTLRGMGGISPVEYMSEHHESFGVCQDGADMIPDPHWHIYASSFTSENENVVGQNHKDDPLYLCGPCLRGEEHTIHIRRLPASITTEGPLKRFWEWLKK